MQHNRALIEHERVHVKQFRQHRFTFWLRYLFSRKWRLRYEAEAYRASIEHGMPLSQAAMLLADRYMLHTDAYQAQKAILEAM